MPEPGRASRMVVLAAALLAAACERQEDSDYGPKGTDSGADVDADADSDDDADTGTEGCLEGSYTIENSLDADLLQPFACVTGSLTVEAPGLAEVELPVLEWIGGDLLVRFNDDLSVLDLGDLTTVGGDLDLAGNPKLESLDGLARLGSVGGDAFFDRNDSLPDLGGLAGLVAVGGDLEVRVNSSLTTLGLDGLASLGGSLSIGSIDGGSGNPALETLGLDNLVSMGGGFLGVAYNGKLPCCEVCDLLERFSAPPSHLYVSDNLADDCWVAAELACP